MSEEQAEAAEPIERQIERRIEQASRDGFRAGMKNQKEQQDRELEYLRQRVKELECSADVRDRRFNERFAGHVLRVAMWDRREDMDVLVLDFSGGDGTRSCNAVITGKDMRVRD